MSDDERNELLSSTVADPQPDEFGRMAVKQTALLKVGVFGDDRIVVGARILPYFLVRLATQTALADVRGTGKAPCQQAGQIR